MIILRLYENIELAEGITPNLYNPFRLQVTGWICMLGQNPLDKYLLSILNELLDNTLAVAATWLLIAALTSCGLRVSLRAFIDMRCVAVRVAVHRGVVTIPKSLAVFG